MNCKAHRIGLLVVMLSLLVGCAKPAKLEKDYVLDYNTPSAVVDDPSVFKIDNTTPYQKLITKELDIHAFAQRYSPVGDRDIDDVMENFGIECLRKTEAGAIYSVHKVTQGGLLYVFYDNFDWDTELAGNSIVRWFYVRDRLTSSDFDGLTEKTDTIDDVIKINETEQIFLNIYRADPQTWTKLWGEFFTTAYLEDGILDIGYKLVDGEFVLEVKLLTKNFDLPDLGAPVHIPYDARILDMDWVE